MNKYAHSWYHHGHRQRCQIRQGCARNPPAPSFAMACQLATCSAPECPQNHNHTFKALRPSCSNRCVSPVYPSAGPPCSSACTRRCSRSPRRCRPKACGASRAPGRCTSSAFAACVMSIRPGARAPIDDYHMALDRPPRGSGIYIVVSGAERLIVDRATDRRAPAQGRPAPDLGGRPRDLAAAGRARGRGAFRRADE